MSMNPRADCAEIRRALSVLVAPGDVCELRIPKAGKYKTVSGYFTDWEALAKAASQWSGQAPGVYVTLNPIDPALLARAHNRAVPYAELTTADANATRRRWLLVDIDAGRPAGISSTDAEHEAALSLAQYIRAELTMQGWPLPILADSGNGGHLLYRVDLPADDGGLLERVLKGLSFRFDTDSLHIDQTVFNAARITKLYGTLAAKGDTTAERPHRLARILDLPGTLTPVSQALLETMAARVPVAAARLEPTSRVSFMDSENGQRLLQAVLPAYKGEDGYERGDEMHGYCPWCSSPAPSESSLNIKEGTFHCFGCNASSGLKELAAKLGIDSDAGDGHHSDAPAPEEPEMGPLPYDVAGTEPLTREADVIPPMGAHPIAQGSTWADLAEAIGPIEWEWERWLAKGFLHILAGASGKGKSSLALRIAACYLRGDPWPDGLKFAGETGKVLWIEAENSQVLNLDRQRKWGLDGDSILSPFSDPFADVCLDNPQHRQAIEAMLQSEDVRLAILDSLSGALGGRRDENDSRILPVMKWLAKLARDAWIPVIVTHHLRKRGQQEVDGPVSLDRLRGSSAIVQVARLVWALDNPDPMQPDALRLSVIKSNLGKFPSPVGVSIDDNGVHFGEAPERPRKPSRFEIAERFLHEILARGPVKAIEVLREADRRDISERTLRRVKEALEIDSPKVGGEYYWVLPAEEGESEGCNLPGF